MSWIDCTRLAWPGGGAPGRCTYAGYELPELRGVVFVYEDMWLVRLPDGREVELKNLDDVPTAIAQVLLVTG